MNHFPTLVLSGLVLSIAAPGSALTAAEPPGRPSSVAPLEEQTAPLVNSVGMTLVHIPAGRFTMGSPADEPGRLGNEGPARPLGISRSFHLGAHEVTVGQFRAFVEATGYETEAERDRVGGFGIDFATGQVRQTSGLTWRDPGFPDHVQSDDHPVILVSWLDTDAFCRWLSEVEGVTYRLPTEAEWEYAARAGSETAWSTGAEAESLVGAANCADGALQRAMPAATWSESWDDGYPFTAPVGRFSPNGLGLHDMHGNVWEWCLDWYRDDAYAAGDEVDPRGPTTGTFRCIRGGGWYNPARQNRSAQRIYFDPSFRYCLLSGFRVVREIE